MSSIHFQCSASPPRPGGNVANDEFGLPAYLLEARIAKKKKGETGRCEGSRDFLSAFFHWQMLIVFPENELFAERSRYNPLFATTELPMSLIR